MSNCTIISIGDELVSGLVLNTTAPFMASKLGARGYSPKNIITLKDSIPQIIQAIHNNKDSSVLILTGGLGPTADDITRNAVAEAFNLSLTFKENVWQQIKDNTIFRKLPNTNKVQAEIPDGFEVLVNKNGTAPGFYKQFENQLVFVLPGPPSELEPMFVEQLIPVLPVLLSDENELAFSTYLIPEALLEESLQQFGLHISWHTVAAAGRVFVSLTGSDVQEAYRLLCARYGDLLIQKGHQEIEERLFKDLQEQAYMLGLGESCTGGQAAARITAMPGSSSVFWGSAVTYANEAKNTLLAVSMDVINQNGAVSAECAREMAIGLNMRMKESGLKKRAGICITGIAGPGGGSTKKPVGTVFISVFVSDNDESSDDCNVTVQRFNFSGNRSFIQKRAYTAAFLMLIALFKGKSSLDILDIADYI